MKSLLAMLLTALLLCTPAQTAAQAPIAGIAPMNAADLRIALQKLSVMGTVLYVAAHPDDENTALLAYLSKGKKYRTVYLSLTRGEGGQNILGSEKGTDLGVIRTQELMDARRIDGAEQMFSRAIDFGFSKSPIESMMMWGRDSVVGDLVWAIRTLRPDIIITRFSPTEGGHGNHTASAILAIEAYERSGDPSAFPGQLQFVRPWKAKKLFYNRLNGFGGGPVGRRPGDEEIDVGAYNPLLGVSYTEIAGISRSMHKTQAMGEEQARGRHPEYFGLTDMDSTDAALVHRRTHNDGLFSGIDASWARYSGGEDVHKILRQAERAFDPEHPERIASLLLRAAARIDRLLHSAAYASDPMLAHKRTEIGAVITSCLGLHLNALASGHHANAGAHLPVMLVMTAAAQIPMTLRMVTSPLLHIDTTLSLRIQPNVKQEVALIASIPSSMTPTQPYWLRTPSDALRLPLAPDTSARIAPGSLYVPPAHLYLYYVPSQKYVGMAEDPDSLVISCDLAVGGETLTLAVPLRYRTIDPVAGELYRPVAIEPAVDIALAEKMVVWTHAGAQRISAAIVLHDSSAAGSVRLRLPKGYAADPSAVSFSGTKKDDERQAAFTVRADSASASGVISAEAATSTRGFTMHGVDISYPHIIPQHVMHEAQLKAVRADIRIVKRKIGYVTGSGDEVPGALRQCGYDVEMIVDDSLERGTLDRFESIVVGVRAYNVRERVRSSNARLLEYVRGGGTLVVQYQTPGEAVGNIGPYPFRISNDRVTVETAEMFSAYPDSVLPRAPGRTGSDAARSIAAALLSVPNRLTADDFRGWVQERGLYFADQWDEHFAAPLICSDPGEPPKQGSLIIARYGKGVYCYTGLSLFRQLPAGVPGAFRLLSNLIEAKGQ